MFLNSAHNALNFFGVLLAFLIQTNGQLEELSDISIAPKKDILYNFIPEVAFTKVLMLGVNLSCLASKKAPETPTQSLVKVHLF